MKRTFKFIEKITPAKPSTKFIALDLETTGLNPRKDSIVGASFCMKEGVGFYTTDIAGLVKVVQDNKLIPIFHNGVFDYSFLKQNGYELDVPFHDTMLLADVLNPDRPTLSLKELAVELLGEGANNAAKEMYKWLESNGLEKDGVHKAPAEILTAYAAEDAVNTYEIFVELCKRVKKLQEYFDKNGIIANPWQYYVREQCALIPVVVGMQLGGVKLDLEATAKKQTELEGKTKELGAELNKINEKQIALAEDILHKRKVEERIKKNKSGKLKKIPPRVSFNWDSNDHLKLLFLQIYKLPITKKTLKGNASVDSSFLESIQNKFTWVNKLLEYKELQKLASTYLSGLLSKQEGGYIHASFNLAGTATGRFSSSNPNLQNLPKNGGIKSLFIPRQGHRFIYADYSQLELRVAAHLSQDTTLIKEYNKQNPDLHQVTADLLGITRDQAKTINFAIIYNASGWRIAEIMGWMDGVPLCSQQVRSYRCECEGCVKRKKAARNGDQVIEKLFGKYTGLKQFVDRQKEFMLKYKITVSEFGKLRRLDGLKSETRSEYNHALKAGFNLPIQSFGASLCKRSMVALASRGYKLVNQIHDSIMVEVPETVLDRSAKEVKNIMEGIYNLSVPLLAEPKILTSFEEKNG